MRGCVINIWNLSLLVELISKERVNKGKKKRKQRERENEENGEGGRGVEECSNLYKTTRGEGNRRTELRQMELLKANALLFQRHYPIGRFPCYQVA